MSFLHLVLGASVVVQMVYRKVSGREDDAIGMAGIFQAGFSEFARLHKQPGVDPRAVVEGAQRVMRVVLSRETDELETHLSFLATVGSTSPYVGLFGTVWGIMNSFRGLGNAQQATLTMVAPGIAEALIATAMGLFAAIPAVIAYNRYSNDVERLINRYDNFLEEFSTILQRQAHV
jgi:biopolymer transport protein TolQ